MDLFNEEYEEQYWLQRRIDRSKESNRQRILSSEPSLERTSSLECIEGSQGKNEEGRLANGFISRPLGKILP